jgi:hypothetical protein
MQPKYDFPKNACVERGTTIGVELRLSAFNRFYPGRPADSNDPATKMSGNSSTVSPLFGKMVH